MKKRNAAPGFLAVLFVLVLAAVWTPEARAVTGSGTEADPYVLTTPADLETLHGNLSAHYALGADINMGGLTWRPVGDGLEGAFTGTLDGRGHTLSHLYLDMGGNKYTGLFGYLEGTVKGVKLDNVQITGGRYTGGIAGNAGVGSAITDCHVLTGAIKAAYPNIDCFMGGIVGLCEGNVTDCSNGARLSTDFETIRLSSAIGGIAGVCAFSPVELRGCTNTGEISQGEQYDNANSSSTTGRLNGISSLGGIIGKTTRPVILENCVNEGSIRAAAGTYQNNSAPPHSSYHHGGMIGTAQDIVRLTGCVNKAASIYATYFRSGLNIYGNFNLGYSGGMVGFLNASGESSIIRCENRGSIGYKDTSSGSAAAAIIGYISGGGTAKIDSFENWSTTSTAVSSGTANAVITGFKTAIKDAGITSASWDLNLGEAKAISGGIEPSGIPLLESIVWTSSDENVATVDQNGVVTAHNWGNATITATTTEVGRTFTAKINVSPEISIDPSVVRLAYNQSVQLNVVQTPAYPAYEDTYTWSSGNSNLFPVDGNGLVQALAGSGSATITVTSTRSGRKATCRILVDSVVIARSVTLNKKILRPVPGERTLLTAAIDPSSTTDKSVTWESDHPEVAAVTGSGLKGTVEAIAPGEATITVRTANGLYDTCQVKVLQLSSAAFVIPDSRGSVNGAFDTAVHLVKNPGVAAFTLTVNYDAAALTPVAVTPCDLLSGGTLTSSLDPSPDGDGALQVTWYSTEDAAEDGPAFTIRWQVKEKTGVFPVSLQYDQQDICNAEKIEVTVKTEAGSVRILDRPVGDVHKDGLVNMKDIVCLARFFNGLETLDSGQQLAADLFYDGEVNVKDLTELAQILSASLPESASAFLLGMEGETLTFTVSDAEAVGDTVTVSVRGSGEPSAALRFRVVPPEGMRVLSVQHTGVLAENGTFAYNEETGIVTWYGETSLSLEGELFTVTLAGAEGASLPDQVDLEYAAGDFFLAGSYKDVPVSVLGGTISRAAAPEIAEAALAGEKQVRVTVAHIDNAPPALLIAAFYDVEGGRMTAVVTKDVDGSGPCLLDVPAGAAGHACKVFLVDKAGQTPLSPSKAVIRG